MSHTIGVFASLFDEEGQIVLVRQSYAGRCWAQPGGRLEPDEDPIAGVLREIYEEAYVIAEITGFIGTYVAPYRNDVVLHFRGLVRKQDTWRPSDEIIACARFSEGDLPNPMRPHTLGRVADGFSGATGIFRVVDAAGGAVSL